MDIELTISYVSNEDTQYSSTITHDGNDTSESYVFCRAHQHKVCAAYASVNCDNSSFLSHFKQSYLRKWITLSEVAITYGL